MTTEIWINDLLKEDRSISEWKRLLECVKTTTRKMSADEKSYLVDEITYNITGQRHSKGEILADIEACSADIDDIGN